MGNIGKKINTNDREKQAYAFYLSKGWSPLQSAAIVGNLLHESGLNPSSEGDIGYKGGSSRGIAQFRGERLKRLKTQYGDNWSDFGNQLEFVNWELNNTHRSVGDALKKSNDIYDAGRIVSDKYEIPAVKFNANKDRQKKVFNTYNKLSGVATDYASYVPNSIGVSSSSPQKSIEIVESPNFIPTNEVVNTDLDAPSQTEDTVAEAKAKEDIGRVTTEQQILEDYFSAGTQNQKVAIQPQVTPEVEQFPNLVDQYAQVSQFVNSPLAQQGGRIYVGSKDDPRYKSYLDSLKLYNSTKRTIKELNSKEYAEEDDIKLGFVPLNDLTKEKRRALVGFGDNKKEENEWFLRYDKELNLEEAKNYIKTVPIAPEKFYKSISGSVYYRPIYKKPEEVLIKEKNPLIKFNSYLKKEGLITLPEASTETDVEIVNKYIQPKYWDVQDNINKNFGGYQQNYRVTPATADYMLRELAPEPYNSRISTPYYQSGGIIGNLTPEQTLDVEKQREWVNYWNSNRVIDGKKVNTNSDIPFSPDIYVDDLNYGNNGRETTLGEFDNVSDRLILDTNFQSKPGIPAHELSHRYQKYLSPDIYNQFIDRPISQALQQTQGSSEYHGNVDENQAELNRLRYNSGFKPDQVITPQDLQKYNSEDYNLKHFSQEQLINLLNSTAYNNYSDVTYAQQGGQIPVSSNGVYDFPMQEVIVPTKNGNITMKDVNYPIMGVDEYGNQILMMPGQEYKFPGKVIHEIPQLQQYFNKR